MEEMLEKAIREKMLQTHWVIPIRGTQFQGIARAS